MAKEKEFDLLDFLPYMLNQAAEASSLAFQTYYKDRYGMLRTEWRVLFHLGRYGGLTASEICTRSMLDKTKVSRAVRALQGKNLLVRETVAADRRNELLALTKKGQGVFEDLAGVARKYDAKLAGQFTRQEQSVLRSCLERIAQSR